MFFFVFSHLKFLLFQVGVFQTCFVLGVELVGKSKGGGIRRMSLLFTMFTVADMGHVLMKQF